LAAKTPIPAVKMNLKLKLTKLDKIPQIKLNLDFERIQEKLTKAAKWKQFKESRLEIIQKYMIIKKVVHRGNQLLALRTMHIIM
jgi:GTP-binding protein EngB required for normal cell division